MKVLAVLVLAHGPVSCGGCVSNETPVGMESSPVALGTVEIALTRASCARAGAEYTLRIQQDGTVSYEGTRNVRVIGQRRASISPDAVRALFEAFDRADYAALTTSAEICASDAPCTSISVRVGSAESRFQACAGPTSDAVHAAFHEAIGELAHAVDEAALSVRWIQDYSDSVDDG